VLTSERNEIEPSFALFVSCSYGLQMASRFRVWEDSALNSGSRTRRQLIVAVTANGAQAGKGGETGGFDEICAKPLGASDIYQVIQKHL
jgi:hypothetical protein